jgi:hypothetical protein
VVAALLLGDSDAGPLSVLDRRFSDELQRTTAGAPAKGFTEAALLRTLA